MEIAGELVKFSLPKNLLTFIVCDLTDYFQKLSKKPVSNVDVLYPLCFYTDMIEFAFVPETTLANFS